MGFSAPGLAAAWAGPGAERMPINSPASRVEALPLPAYILRAYTTDTSAFLVASSRAA